jgi:hypothetical protein
LLSSQPGDDRQEVVSTVLKCDKGAQTFPQRTQTLQLVFSRETEEFVDIVDVASSAA